MEGIYVLSDKIYFGSLLLDEFGQMILDYTDSFHIEKVFDETLQKSKLNIVYSADPNTQTVVQSFYTS